MTDELKQWEYDKGYTKGQIDILEKMKAEFEDKILLNQTVAIKIIDKHISELKGDINNKQCGNCKFCVPSSSIFDSGVGYCTKTDEGIRVSLGSYCCDKYEEGETNDGK